MIILPYDCLIIMAVPKDKRQVLCDKLTILAEHDSGLNSIVSSLLLTPDDCQSREQIHNVTQFILDWLLGMWPFHELNNELLCFVLSLPIPLILKILWRQKSQYRSKYLIFLCANSFCSFIQ